MLSRRDSSDDEIRLDELDDHLLEEADLNDDADLLDDANLLDEADVLDAPDGGSGRLASKRWKWHPSPVSVDDDPVAPVEIPAADPLPAAVAELLPEEVDDEIIEVFFEEADEILEALEENISTSGHPNPTTGSTWSICCAGCTPSKAAPDCPV